MLVAFLYDLMLRKESAGKATLANRYRELFSRSGDPAEGNKVIIKLLSSSPEARRVRKKYIEGSAGAGTSACSEELHTDQPGLLKSLGYG
jgi:hypothetical protein